ncbi:hypothetical protein [Polyangium aurulentum]|uniref:hypothetical protein n=1 Tax=Polyangium aurulentum TaxID=2567896 RepID=UPI0010ADE775|nr:hypothetical protein [Polyangium aurulentum]UQA55745.1 hypothetical protein E8A73_030980 [Polyangium aurulentum]
MNKRIMGFLVGAIGLAGATTLSLSGASCSQPAIACVVGHGSFYARYTLISSTGTGCDQLKGDEVGFSTYLAPNADKSLADYDNRSIAVQSLELGSLRQQWEVLQGPDNYDRENNKAYAFGKYSSAPDDNNICYAGGAGGTPALAPAELNLPEVTTMDDEGNMETEPARHVRQEWKNIRVYVTADAPGTQAVGEMTYEDVLLGCSATYSFIALYPAHYCGVDHDGDAATDDVPSEDECNPKADPSKGRVFGSGINPDFKVRCDPEVLYCVLADKSLAAP